ncbi:hypothetical protein BaRGS_00025763 [Batillaria attramentaria]|uniref:IgGFc-binding protein N-terminal domain-containing protein n=1 Tax=Batillaria attramentaria TaxID=370345 RepID=A0ABD0K7P8_9CAEN
MFLLPGGTAGDSFVLAFPQSIFPRNMTSKIFIVPQGASSVDVTITTLPTAPDVINTLLTAQPGDVTTFTPKYTLETPVGTVVADVGLRILTSSPVVINVEDAGPSNTDAFPVMPTSLLGTEYFAVGFSKTYGLSASFILLVASQDETEVTVALNKLQNGDTVTLNDVTYDRHDVITVRLNALQVLQVQAMSDLTGTKVTASKPVAAFSGQNRTYIYGLPGTGLCWSHMSDQLPPRTHWGRSFALITSPRQEAGDYYRFVAGWANTNIVLRTSPETAVHLTRAGDFFEYVLENGTFVYAESDKPVMVVWITPSFAGEAPGGDPSLGILAPLEQAESSYVFVSDAAGNYKQFVAVTVKGAEKGGVQLNSDYLLSYNVAWSPVPETDLVVGIVELQDLDQRQVLTLSHVTGHVFGAHVSVRTRCEARSMPLTYGRPMEINQTAHKTPELIPAQDVPMRLSKSPAKASEIYGNKIVDVRKTAENVNYFVTRVHSACAVMCVRHATCWGYNYAPYTTTGNNCELLSGTGLGMVPADGWLYLSIL